MNRETVRASVRNNIKASRTGRNVVVGGVTQAAQAASRSPRFSGGNLPAGSSLPVLKQGFLHKEGGNVKNWRNRWFVLTSVGLSYFKNPADKAMIDEIELAKYNGCIVEKTKGSADLPPFCFALQPLVASDRTYYMIAASEDDMNEWVESINAVVSQLRPYVEKMEVVKALVATIRDKGVTKEGIFRQPGNVKEVKALAEQFAHGDPMDIASVNSPHTLVALLKRIIKDELRPHPLSDKLQQSLLKAFQEKAMIEERVRSVKAVVEKATPPERDLLRCVLSLCHDVVCKREVNQCTIDDVCRSMGPVLLPTVQEDQARVILDTILTNFLSLKL
eukprot:m.157404 g.157404  ORF g.157404 m.157404 type:complete len:333 (+) comp17004_c1_seq9:1135-2133(+)